jgi:hypothetical protein
MDGIHWSKCDWNPVLSSYDAPEDSAGPWAPDVVFDGTEYNMLYEAAGADGEWICLATSRRTGVDSGGGVWNVAPGQGGLGVMPNPCHARTVFAWRLPSVTPISLSIYDAAGQLVRSLVDRTAGDAEGQAVWDGTDDRGRQVVPALYVCRLRAGVLRGTTRLVLLR